MVVKIPWKSLRRVVLFAAANAVVVSSGVSVTFSTPLKMTMMSRLQVEGPCIASAVGAPLKNCIQWEPNVSAFPTYEPSRRLVFSGAADDLLHVVDADNGRHLAAVVTAGRVVTKITFDFTSGRAYFGTDKGTFYCIDGYSFQQIFSVNADSKINNNLVLVNDAVIFTTAVGTVYAVDAKSGDVRWRLEQPLAKERLRLSQQSNIIVQNGEDAKSTTVIVPHNDGYLSVIDARSGKLIKRIDLGVLTGNGSPDIVAPMVVQKNRLWVASYDLGLCIVDLLSLRMREQIPVKGVLALATDGATIFAATSEEMMALSESGGIKWRGDFSKIKSRSNRAGFPFNIFSQGARRMFFGMPSGMLVDDQHIMLSTSLGSIGVFDKLTGRLIEILGNSVGFSGIEWSGPRSFMAISKRGILMKFGG